MLDNKGLKYFAERRAKLLSQIEKNSIVIIPSNTEVLRNGDAHYSFRQDSNFYYLTGFCEPDSFAVLLNGPNGEQSYILFVRPSDPAKEQWDGIRAGLSGAKSEFQADESYDIADLELKIVEFMKDKSKIYYDLGCDQDYDHSVIQWLNQVKKMQRQGISAPDEIVNVDNILSEMRLIKDDYEKLAMRKASAIAALSHTRAMQVALDCEYEYQLEAEILYECCKHGAQKQAYNPIVGSGANTCILHYSANNQKIDKQGLVLIDAGAEYDHYAADITRTFPASGKFTDDQKAIYELVLQAQLAAIEQVKPGNTWNSMQDVILEVITAGLVKLGIINDHNKSITELIEAKAYKPFYMHNSGHWLGIDVHDVGSYKIENKWRQLQPGMVLTVEPGIYIKAGLPEVDKKWWNIGVRIEDDVLVTENGHEVMTKDVPKQIHEIEELMRAS